MVDAKTFCTCPDTECPFNPVNHDQGCTPCMEHNIELGEMPSCLINKAGLERRREGYDIEEYSRCVVAKLDK